MSFKYSSVSFMAFYSYLDGSKMNFIYSGGISLIFGRN
jgi:hypothetical protein